MSLGKRLFVGGGSAFCMNTSDNPLQEATSSLVAGYSLDYDASDITGDYNGTSSNVTYGVDGYINWGAEFNGSSSKITVPLSKSDISGTNGAVSVSWWMNAASDHLGFIFEGNADQAYMIHTNTSGVIRVGLASSDLRFDASSAYTVGEWTHFVATFTDTEIKLYKNGNSTAIGSDTHTSSVTIPDFSTAAIGFRDYGASENNFNGKLDQVRIFNKELSSDEVGTLYNESACTHTATTDTVGFPLSASSNLLAYYKLDGSTKDEDGNTHYGTPTNITYEFGKYGTAAVFNGSSSYIDVGSSIGNLMTSGFTVSLWVNTDSSDNDGHSPLSFMDNIWINIFLNSGNVVYARIVDSSASTRAVTSTDTLINNGWNHIVFKGDNGEVELYLNNVSQGTETWNGTNYDRNNNNVFGQYGQLNVGRWFEGKLDQVRIYDKALSSDEVGELYAEKQAYITKDAKNPFADGDEVAFYKFENNADDEHDSYDGTDSNVTYTSGSGLFGTYAAEFNGSSSVIDVTATGTTPIDFSSSDFTFSAWINCDDVTSDDRTIISKYGGSNNAASSFIFDINDNDQKLRLITIGGTTSYGLPRTTSTIPTGEWLHVVVTRGDSTIKFYINGALDSSHSSTNSINSGGTTDITIGRRGGTSKYFDGEIEQLRIFDRALDGDEVFKLYAEVIN